MKKIIALGCLAYYLFCCIIVSDNVQLIGVAASKKIPIAAGAPKYEPKKWNDQYGLNTYNCYAYAFNFMLNPLTGTVYDGVDEYGIQPGYFSEKPYRNQISDNGITLKNVMQRVITDMKGVGYKINKVKKKGINKKIKSKKKFLVYLQVTKKPKNYTEYDKKKKIATKYYSDYHWYRQDKNGKWSHKRGSFAVTNKDSKNKVICNPQKAKKNYLLNLFPYIPGGPPYELFGGTLYSVKSVVDYNGSGEYYIVTKGKKK